MAVVPCGIPCGFLRGNINMYSRVETAKKDKFLEDAKAARCERASERGKESATIKIQALVRSFLARQRLRRKLRSEIDEFLQIQIDADKDYKPKLRAATELYTVTGKLLFVYQEKQDRQRIEFLCKYILQSMTSDNVKVMYVSLAVNKKLVLPWIQQLKRLLCLCCGTFYYLKPELSRDLRSITTFLHMLITFSGCSNWKIITKLGEAMKPGMVQLCNNIMGYLHTKGLYQSLQKLLLKGLARSKPCFTAATLTAILTVSTRPLIAADFSHHLLTLFILHILAVPGLLHHLTVMKTDDCMAVLVTERVFSRCMEFLSDSQSTKIVFNTLEGNYALCLLANLIQLGSIEMEGLVSHTDRFMVVMTHLLESCKLYVQNKKSHLTNWHPLLGWFAAKSDQGLLDAMPFVRLQLQQLWSVKMLRLLFEPLFTYNDLHAAAESNRAKLDSSTKNPIKKAIEKASIKNSAPRVKLDSPVLVSTCRACGMYRVAMTTLAQLKMDIVAGLCYKDILLPRLWKMVIDLGPGCGIKGFMEILHSRPNDTSHMVFDLLQLSCDTACHILTILDEVEMYEENKPFTLDNLVAISYFLNNFVFKVIWTGLIDAETATKNPVFQSALGFLMLIYERDCRRNFTPPNHWLISEVKPSLFMSELEKGRKSAKLLLETVPHIVPHKERVILFRKRVQQEKEALGLTESAHTSPQPTLITVYRRRMVEDGYRQLALVPSNSLKGVIRVKFVNEQGLDEAGIDQDGVFKEFLEETIKHVFDPSLNLFKVTEEQKLYPSPTSYIQDNHLSLFEFVGRMLGKAVYEGIVVEVPFAPFFLSQILGHSHRSTYSSVDELPSLDKDLYKSLTYVKHYEGDISDLDLTFSYDEDVMGKIINHELVPGGRIVPVTNDNKISYVHLMAHHKMMVQIRQQTSAFLHGFKSIIPSHWLTVFSAPELQKLISGDTADIDLGDLRKHTQYYGGFHNNHKVVSWLWDILQKDFTSQERSLFLRFVTSCSKAPLLGFAHLEPPFSIRCVEVSEDQDTGDTLGSVLKGFLNIRKKDPVGRLPTSSTCFNLLKLPNYQKKQTLREKLRYAISSNTGFELS